jgi:hypothetical protein
MNPAHKWKRSTCKAGNEPAWTTHAKGMATFDFPGNWITIQPKPLSSA